MHTKRIAYFEGLFWIEKKTLFLLPFTQMNNGNEPQNKFVRICKTDKLMSRISFLFYWGIIPKYLQYTFHTTVRIKVYASGYLFVRYVLHGLTKKNETLTYTHQSYTMNDRF